MDVKEKLVELLDKSQPTPYCDVPDMNCDICEYNHPKWHCVDIKMANYLIAHGVTVQDNTEIPDELLKQLRNTPLTVLHEEPTIEVVQDWISVDDRLPEIYDKEPDWSVTVLFRTIQGHIHSGYRNIGRPKKSFYDDDWTPPYWLDESGNLTFEEDEVTHWMPLPQPPKGELL